jgi:urate oxidase / 2-oxo-4-hydroxy-4-carboxy-5-ureidoimidazoline decarboxylase
MYYGKGEVYAYRTYALPLTGVKKIPESPVCGRENIILGLNVHVAIGGSQFLSSFTDGDNKLIVATDSMKNFIQRHLSSYTGSTTDGFLYYVAKRFLETYPQMETVNISAEELPFLPTYCVEKHELKQSKLVFKKSRNERQFSRVEIVREDKGIKVVNHQSGIKDLQLIKISGNSFVGFVSDEYTSLPEDSNRPLFIYLNIYWKYQEQEDGMGENFERYVLAEQVSDISSSVFHNLETKSIQQLIYQIGIKVLERFPQLSEVQFESQNRTWETVVDEIPDTEGKVYTEPRPPYGFQRFTVFRKDIDNENPTMNQGGKQL